MVTDLHTLNTTDTNYAYPDNEKKHNTNQVSSYTSVHNKNINRIKDLLNKGLKIKYYSNFIEIGGVTFNGITKTMLMNLGVEKDENY